MPNMSPDGTERRLCPFLVSGVAACSPRPITARVCPVRSLPSLRAIRRTVRYRSNSFLAPARPRVTKHKQNELFRAEVELPVGAMAEANHRHRRSDRSRSAGCNDSEIISLTRSTADSGWRGVRSEENTAELQSLM